MDKINNLKKLHLCQANGDFVDLPEFIFKNCQVLVELKLENFDLHLLNKNHFYGLENLETLHLSALHLSDRFDEEIYNLPKLKKLYLRNLEFGKFSLKGFDNLESLFLHDVKFTSKTSNTLFKNLKCLKEFHYTKSRIYNYFNQEIVLIKNLFQNINAENAKLVCQHEIIQSIYPEPIPFLKNLKSLVIRFDTEIQDINSFFLYKRRWFPKLEELYLSTEHELNNEISVGLFKGFQNLKTLSLNGCLVESVKLDTTFDNYLFKNMFDFYHLKSLLLDRFPNNFMLNECFLEKLKNLEELSLLFNPYLRTRSNVLIDPEATFLFKNLIKLKRLTMNCLSLNIVKSSYFDHLVDLVELDLSINEIQFIEAGSFKNLNKLELLSLQYNHINLIDEKSFAGLGNLRALNLSGNSDVEMHKNYLYDMGKLQKIKF